MMKNYNFFTEAIENIKIMEKERLKFCIVRFDHYYDTINNKCNVFLGLSTFIVGGLIASYPTLNTFINCSLVIQFLILILIGLGIAIMITVILASTPYYKKSSESLYYFVSISQMTSDQFSHSSKLFTQEQELQDLRDQVLHLSQGLISKFNKLKIAGRLFTIQFSLLIPFIILITLNLK